jgi:hypothetical protein
VSSKVRLGLEVNATDGTVPAAMARFDDVFIR